MRITSGQYKGRVLKTPRNDKIRPTTDKIRQAIFNILQHAPWSRGLNGSVICDGFAGTGALGIEALSRGAAQAYFFDVSAEALGLIKENLKFVKEEYFLYKKSIIDCASVLSKDIVFDFIFLDPPYKQEWHEKTLKILRPYINDKTIFILEEGAKTIIGLPPEYQIIDHKFYGDTQILFVLMADGAVGEKGV